MAAPPRDLGHIPGPVYIPQVAAVRIIWRLPNTKLATNVLHGKFTGTTLGATQAAVNALFTAITSAFTSSLIQNVMHHDLVLQQIGVRDLTFDTTTNSGFGEIKSTLAGASGGAGGSSTALPSNVAFAVTLGSGHSHQANRGRVFLPGFDVTADQGDGFASPSVVSDAPLFIQDIQSAMASFTPSLVMCIAHPARQAYTSPRTGISYPARAAGSIPVSNISARDNVWDTQRLRVRP
jgi:hypothetical protein